MMQKCTTAEAIETILSIDTPILRIAMPLGIGKPNHLVNHLYRAFKNKPERQLEIYTALSLLLPEAGNELEARFLEPLLKRLYGDYPDLEYARDALNNRLPQNIRVYEFFLKSGDWLKNASAQQHYISSNYTHIARDMAQRQPHVVIQAVSAKITAQKTILSLSSNPDTSLELKERLKNQGSPCLFIAAINRELPFMPGEAETAPDFFDLVINEDESTHTLFCTPNSKVSKIDYAIGIHASCLVRDGGTLQIGIGSLGDAIAQSLIVRHIHNHRYCSLLASLQKNRQYPACTETFSEGLYGCSEMLVNGLLELVDADIIKRKVKDKRGRTKILDAGFFIGPKKFYRKLCELPENTLNTINMQRIDFINHLYGDEAVKRDQRKDAVFINTCMMITLSGSAVSDALEDGRIVSGIGGQYNFVAMAHELENARSVLLLRATRMQGGKLQSNIVTHYGHCSIPKHLRDIVITEYGIAELRGKTDSEVAESLIKISDSRFQQNLIDWAIAHQKLPADFVLDPLYTNNTPETVWQKIEPYRDILPAYPFGHDFTEEEIQIINTLRKLEHAQEHPAELLKILIHALFPKEKDISSYLQRMGYNEERLTLKQALLKKLFAGNL
ncbi:MAG: acetyl-CoA hydrolase [Pseudomonadales bacterium]|nr:acetyl-CoA hydrolase [Pseudomonadales bacterium]